MTSDSKWKLVHTPPPSDWRYENRSASIVCPSAKGGERTIIDMRGWGYLTGKGHRALGLDSETAGKEQDALAEFIIEACRRAAAPPAPGGDVVAQGPPFIFDRYVNGTLMAEGVTIERQDTLENAMAAAARIASRGPSGEVPVLVYTPPTAEEIARRAYRDAADAAREYILRIGNYGCELEAQGVADAIADALSAALAKPPGETGAGRL